jgi:lipid-A-disaccharide synthase
MRVMISCGEASGDLYAGALATALRTLQPDVDITGFGGQRLRAAGAVLDGEFTGLTVTGLTEALRVIPRSYAMYRRLVAAARSQRPDVFVAIDFPDFNFRLMAALHRLGVPVVYYISPQLWAWRPGRMKTMRRYVDRVLVIFPFEAPLYDRAGIPAEFVGHPLVELAQAEQPRNEFLHALSLDPEAPTVALLPGSRPSELRHLVPVIADALPEIRSMQPRVQFVVARAPNLDDDFFRPLERHGATIVRDRTDDVLSASDVVVTASGTATVQAALHARPMVVVYRLSPMTYRLGRPFVSVDMYAMPNLVAGRRVVPELIQEELTAGRIAAETVRLLTDGNARHAMCDGLREVRTRLGEAGASARAARAVLDTAQRRSRGVNSA